MPRLFATKYISYIGNNFHMRRNRNLYEIPLHIGNFELLRNGAVWVIHIPEGQTLHWTMLHTSWFTSVFEAVVAKGAFLCQMCIRVNPDHAGIGAGLCAIATPVTLLILMI